jgi:hypothetical protein
MHVKGSCHCGAIRFEADIETGKVSVCHCTDCQTLTGTAFRLSVPAAPGSFRVLAGTPRVYLKKADSGRVREQGFCELCGTPLYATSHGPEPRVYNLRLGSLPRGDRDRLRAARQIWYRSRLPWLPQIADAPAIDGDPG